MIFSKYEFAFGAGGSVMVIVGQDFQEDSELASILCGVTSQDAHIITQLQLLWLRSWSRYTEETLVQHRPLSTSEVFALQYQWPRPHGRRD